MSLTDLHSGKQSKKFPPNFVTATALSYFGQHAKDIKNGTGRYVDKPAVESYSAYQNNGAADQVEAADSAVAMGEEKGEEGTEGRDGSASSGDASGESSAEESESKSKKSSSAKAPPKNTPAKSSPKKASPKANDKPTTKSPAKSLKRAPSQVSLHSSFSTAATESKKDTGYKSSARDALRAHKAVKKKHPNPVSEMRSVLFLAPPQPSPTKTADSLQPTDQSMKKPITDEVLPTELDNHHLYRDDTGFTYNITLVRVNIVANVNERFIIRLFESHSVPKTYATHLRYVKPKTLPISEILVPAGTDFEVAFKAFRKTFMDKTNVEWENRWKERVKRGPGEGVEVIEDGGKPFLWVRPREGEPRGLMQRVSSAGIGAGAVTGNVGAGPSVAVAGPSAVGAGPSA